jgi:hypothetical protein
VRGAEVMDQKEIEKLIESRLNEYETEVRRRCVENMNRILEGERKALLKMVRKDLAAAEVLSESES